MKHALYLLGALLLALGFFAIVAEMAAHAQNTDLPAIASAADVWRTFDAAGYGAVENSLGMLSAIFALPGWVLLGVPGFALVIVFRTQEEDDSHRAHEDSLFLFDELTKRAQEEGFAQMEDDFAPSDIAREDLADESYAQDDIVVEGQSGHDFLLNGKARADKS